MDFHCPRPLFMKRLALACSAAMIVTIGASNPAEASFQFADLVAERNLATQGFATETFPYGADQVNRFNGALSYTASIGNSYPVGGDLSYGFHLQYTSNIWRFDVDGGTVSAEIDRRFDAGAGWNLSFGELIPPFSAENPSQFWLYRTPQGQVSRFYQTLNVGDPAVANTFYTRDSTYSRLTLNGSQAIVAFIEGGEKVFDQQANGEWRFTQERDLYGNFFTMTYSPGQRHVTDSHGRVHTIYLQADPANPGAEIIDRIEVAAFAGTTAVYDLSYTTMQVVLPPQDTDSSTPAQQSLSVLSSITLPNGRQSHFQYFAPGESAVAASGRMKSLELVTGGLFDYTYQVVELPKVPGALHVADVIGIATRASRLPSGVSSQGLSSGVSLPHGLWQFAMTLDRDRDSATNAKPRELNTRVTYPDGHNRDYKFSAYAGGDALGDHANPATFTLRDYSFPFSKRHVAANAPLAEGSQIFEADGSLARTMMIRYNFVACSGCWDQQPSINGFRTIFEDGSGVRETNLMWTRRELGRWQTSVSPDNVNGGPKRFIHRTFSSGVPPANQPWVRLGWTERTQEEGSEAQTRQRCLDPTTGQVLRERILAGATPAAHDLIRSYSYYATGERATIRYYGGDTQAVPTGDLCSLSLPSQEQYAEHQTFQYGSLAGVSWLAADGSTFLQTLNATIDPNTGLTVSDSGANGLVTSHTYDALGRVTSSIPAAGHGYATWTTYQPASGTVGLTQRTVVLAADGVTELEKRELKLDAFGRVNERRNWSPNGWLSESAQYDGLGRETAIFFSDGTASYRLGFDALGRVGTSRPREGSIHDQTFSYFGRSTTKTVKIGKQWDETSNSVVEIDRSITTTLDRFGRVIERQTVDADGQQRTETYQRGLGGHIFSTVISDGTTSDTQATPKLSDHRGFRIQTSAGDPISGYDAMGNLTVVDFGEGPVAQIFDRAGRLIEQREGSATGPLWTRNVYAPVSLGNDLRGGNLVSSLRVNRNIPHLAGGEVFVTDHYTYMGDGGSVSEMRTTVTAGNQTIFSFETSRSVDAGGAIASMTFPDCDPSTNDAFSFCTPRVSRVMHTERSYGRIVGLSATVDNATEDWISGVVHDYSGQVVETVLGNGIVSTQTPDSGGSGRLAQLTLLHSNSGAFYDSGLAQYDGLGKLVKLGTQRRVADHAYQLTLPPIPAANGTTLTPSTFPKDRLGQRTRRDYKVPYRWDPASGQQEQVNEIYVYGPGNRMVWNRRFNDYQASSYRNSLDSWYLVDPSGRSVREVTSLTHYAGTQPQWSDAVVSAVAMHVAGELTQDKIFIGDKLIGRTDDRANSPARVFFHRDFFGRRFAESSSNGTVDAFEAPLH